MAELGTVLGVSYASKQNILDPHNMLYELVVCCNSLFNSSNMLDGWIYLHSLKYAFGRSYWNYIAYYNYVVMSWYTDGLPLPAVHWWVSYPTSTEQPWWVTLPGTSSALVSNLVGYPTSSALVSELSYQQWATLVGYLTKYQQCTSEQPWWVTQSSVGYPTSSALVSEFPYQH